mgnify:CR=1 FL=1
MRLALLEAEKAFLDGEVPVGAVIVRDGEVVSTGRNRREKGILGYPVAVDMPSNHCHQQDNQQI